jgi:predicted AAA+ superfamily ATPase
MQVELSTVLSIFATFLSISMGVIVAVARIAIGNREKEIDRRSDEQGKKLEAIDSRLHIEEKSTIRQDGVIDRLKDTHTNLASDVEEIKHNMFTKGEGVQLEKNIERILQSLERRPGYAGGGSSQYSQVRSESPPSPPPRKDKP